MASLWIHGIIFFVLLMQQSLILVAVASSNVSLSFVNYMCLLFCLIIDLVFLIILFGGFVYFYGFGRFALCIWERDSIDRKSTRLNSSHYGLSRMPSSA